MNKQGRRNTNGEIRKEVIETEKWNSLKPSFRRNTDQDIQKGNFDLSETRKGIGNEGNKLGKKRHSGRASEGAGGVEGGRT